MQGMTNSYLSLFLSPKPIIDLIMSDRPSKYLPNQENITTNSASSEAYFYCDNEGLPIFKTKEVFKDEAKIVLYPYSVSPTDGIIKSKRIQKIEFLGWNSLEDIPNDFKVTGKYGLRTQRTKAFFNGLYSRYREARVFTIGLKETSKFKADHITLNWAEVKNILNELGREKYSYDKEKSLLITKNLAKINSTIRTVKRVAPAGELQRLLNRFDSFEKINGHDLNALSAILDLVPPTLIKTTANFINSKEKINKVYIEDLIVKFEKLMSSPKDNEKQWQEFFGTNAWILSHLFPFEVILRKQEAYVGGKTFENQDGRIIDFLFENGFKDNYALLEVKTHKKELLKKKAYREPAAFAMSDDLSGGISQCLDQKDTFPKTFGKENPSFDPKCILIIGQKELLSKHQKSCFELLRSGLKSVDIVTFDEVLLKLKGLNKVLNLK